MAKVESTVDRYDIPVAAISITSAVAGTIGAVMGGCFGLALGQPLLPSISKPAILVTLFAGSTLTFRFIIKQLRPQDDQLNSAIAGGWTGLVFAKALRAPILPTTIYSAAGAAAIDYTLYRIFYETEADRMASLALRNDKSATAAVALPSLDRAMSKLDPLKALGWVAGWLPFNSARGKRIEELTARLQQLSVEISLLQETPPEAEHNNHL